MLFVKPYGCLQYQERQGRPHLPEISPAASITVMPGASIDYAEPLSVFCIASSLLDHLSITLV